MTNEEFRENGHRLVDWIADFYQNIEQYPVKSQVSPGEILSKLPDAAPDKPSDFNPIFQDFVNILLPGITHWQHPNFHAFFPANSSYPSILGELLTSALGAQCMIWETSPAAAELEEKVMEWFKQMMNLPTNWHGVIQDTASTATLAALLTAREKKTNFEINQSGFNHQKLRVYCSTETHSSIEKAVKIAGIGKKNLIKIPVDDNRAMIPALLQQAIEVDLANGYIPCAIVSALGTTGTLAFDPVDEIGHIAVRYSIWHHIDAAYAGSAFLLPEYQHYTQGFELADSYVFNPHKWLFTNFDCTAYFVKDKNALIDTFEVLPEYLKTKTRGKVNDYRDWGIPLGRRFRALKLWMVIRTYGVSGLQQKLRAHNEYGKWLADQIHEHPDFELMAPQVMNMVVFRYNPGGKELAEINALNEALIQCINVSGKAYLTHTKIEDKYVIRLVTGQTFLEKRHVSFIWDLIVKSANNSN